MNNMDEIYLISCVAKKLEGTHEAWKLYSPSTLFKAHWNWALKKAKDPSKIFILSAKHELISPFKKIAKYDLTLKNMSKIDKINWTNNVINQLQNKFDLNKTKFIILAGRDYYEYLIQQLPHYELVPNEPLPIGKRVQWFQEQLKKL